LQLGTGIVVGAAGAALLNLATGGQALGSVGIAMLPIIAVTMLAVGLIASIGPARRGLSVQPTEALRAE
jgi:ABC-type antimicrobial peptide transport system permease subunit